MNLLDPSSPLRYPPHFPPTTGWKKFFIGVRGLGPDLSFFDELREQQGRRTLAMLEIWGGGLRQDIAVQLSKVLMAKLKWRSPVFLPEDSAVVAFHGPRFDAFDSDVLEAAIDALHRGFQIRTPLTFWQGRDETTLGQLVDELVQHKAA